MKTETYCIYLRKSRADLDAEQRGEGETLAKELSVINIDDVTSEMGFPKNWRELNDQ